MLVHSTLQKLCAVFSQELNIFALVDTVIDPHCLIRGQANGQEPFISHFLTLCVEIGNVDNQAQCCRDVMAVREWPLIQLHPQSFLKRASILE